MMRGHATYARPVATVGRDKAAPMLNRTESEFDRLVRDDPTFPKPTVINGEPRFYLNELLAWKNMDWLRNPKWRAS